METSIVRLIVLLSVFLLMVSAHSASAQQMGPGNMQMGMNSELMPMNNTQMPADNAQMSSSNEQNPAGNEQITMRSAVIIADNSSNVLDIIRGDHAVLMALSEDVEILRSSGKYAMADKAFAQLVALASAHMAAEERVFYPALEDVDKTVILSAIDEHNLTKQKANELGSIPIESDLWGAKFKVMTDLTQHHIDEEQSTVFALAKLALGEEKLNDIGMRFKQEENALLQ